MVKPRKRRSETKKEFDERLAAWQVEQGGGDAETELEDHGDDNDEVVTEVESAQDDAREDWEEARRAGAQTQSEQLSGGDDRSVPGGADTTGRPGNQTSGDTDTAQEMGEQGDPPAEPSEAGPSAEQQAAARSESTSGLNQKDWAASRRAYARPLVGRPPVE